MIINFLIFIIACMAIYEAVKQVFVYKVNVLFGSMFLMLNTYIAAICARDIALQTPFNYSFVWGIVILAFSALFYQSAEAREDDFDKVFWGIAGIVGAVDIIGGLLK